MTSADRWREVTAARIPAEGITALAPVRSSEDVRIHPDGTTAWIEDCRLPNGSARQQPRCGSASSTR